jgi:hypothetical protein
MLLPPVGGEEQNRPTQYGDVRVYLVGDTVLTILPDSRALYAAPNYDPESVARAASLGYPDVEAMTREHDPMHSRLAYALGLKESPALSRAANGAKDVSDLTDAEECMVLAAQRFLNLCRAEGLV